METEEWLLAYHLDQSISAFLDILQNHDHHPCTQMIPVCTQWKVGEVLSTFSKQRKLHNAEIYMSLT